MALATLVALGAVYGLHRPLDPDELTTSGAPPRLTPLTIVDAGDVVAKPI
jgi:hypothetical protein